MRTTRKRKVTGTKNRIVKKPEPPVMVKVVGDNITLEFAGRRIAGRQAKTMPVAAGTVVKVAAGHRSGVKGMFVIGDDNDAVWPHHVFHAMIGNNLLQLLPGGLA